MSKKYCIYKKPWGDIEAWEYIDDLDIAMSYWYIQQAIDKYGIENVMPICMNKCGGYHTIIKEECIGIIEADTWPTLSSHYDIFKIKINNPKFNYGWIDSIGNTYMCSYMEHAAIASDLVRLHYPAEYSKSNLVENKINAPDEFLLEKDWIKVIAGNPNSIYYEKYVTKEALKKLLELKGN